MPDACQSKGWSLPALSFCRENPWFRGRRGPHAKLANDFPQNLGALIEADHTLPAHPIEGDRCRAPIPRRFREHHRVPTHWGVSVQPAGRRHCSRCPENPKRIRRAAVYRHQNSSSSSFPHGRRIPTALPSAGEIPNSSADHPNCAVTESACGRTLPPLFVRYRLRDIADRPDGIVYPPLAKARCH